LGVAAAAAAFALPWVAPSVPQLIVDAVAPPTQVAQAVAPPAIADPPRFIGPLPVAHTARLSGRLPAAGVPMTIKIARLQVDTAVVPISGASGVLLPPSDPQMIGWWREGRVPGAGQGTLVLTGHTVHTGGGAFDHLGALLPGDIVRVRTAPGAVKYQVVSVVDYRKGALSRHAQDIFRRSGQSRLILITCSQWTGTKYLANTVVTAVPVGYVTVDPPRWVG
jgi:LPXTG-site transpeptidase (sortase) family protein